MGVKFYRRGKLIEVDEVEGVGVVFNPVDPDIFGDLAEESNRTPSTDEVRLQSVSGLKLGEVVSFRRSRWSLVETSNFDAEATSTMTEAKARLDGRLIRERGAVKIISSGLIVKFKGSISTKECEHLLDKFGLEIVRTLKFSKNLYETRVIGAIHSGDKSVELQENYQNVVEYAEPVLFEQFETRNHHNEQSDFEQQWQWKNINAEIAWKTTRGEGVRVAVIDRGFKPFHPLLRPNVVEGSGWFDIDRNFSTDLTRMPFTTHGNFCAAQVAAASIDAESVCGAAPNAELMLIATTGKHEIWVSQGEVALAVSYAADPSTLNDENQDGFEQYRGADILSCAEGPKYGKGILEPVLEEAIEFAYKKGRNGKKLPMFWSVSNFDVPISDDEWVSHPRLIRVGSSTHDNKVAPECAYGPDLDFLAPGEHVYNLGLRKPINDTGTSFAAPVAAGVAALVLSIAPHLTAKQVRELMRRACRKFEPLSELKPRDDYYGFGIVDAARAVAEAKKS